MRTDQNTAGHQDHAHRGGAVARVLAVAVTVLTLAACGLRAETPPPVEPSPDAVEQVRARTVADSLALSAAATAAAPLPDAAAPPVAAVLADVVGFSDQHADQLGGVYVSGLPAPTGSPTTSAPTSATVTEVLEVLDDLAAATRTAVADADAVTDAPLARLLASVATSRGELATRLAQATGAPVPPLVPDATAAPADPSPTPADSDTLSATEAGVLSLVHDEAGYGFEVIAAKLSAEQRATAVATAASHRVRSEDWAAAAGIDGSAQDPRRAAYTLPAGLDDPVVATALGRTLETAAADAYANAVAQVGPGSRATLIEGLRRATVDAAVWGATPVPFPGLPERTQQPTG